MNQEKAALLCSHGRRFLHRSPRDTLLHGMGQLVGQKSPTLGALHIKHSRAEKDILSLGNGVPPMASGHLVSIAVGVELHAGEIRVQLLLHVVHHVLAIHKAEGDIVGFLLPKVLRGLRMGVFHLYHRSLLFNISKGQCIAVCAAYQQLKNCKYLRRHRIIASATLCKKHAS